MKTLLLIGKSVLINAVPQYIRLGWIALPQELEFPLVEVCYDLPELLSISPLLRTMQERELTPQVFLWKEDGQEPDVLVVFEVGNASPDAVKSILGGGVVTEAITQGENRRVLTAAAANTEVEQLQQFLDFFHQNKQAVVVITDATSVYTQENRLVDPVQMFEVRSIEQFKPDLELF